MSMDFIGRSAKTETNQMTHNALHQPRICRSEAKANTSAGCDCWALSLATLQ